MVENKYLVTHEINASETVCKNIVTPFHLWLLLSLMAELTELLGPRKLKYPLWPFMEKFTNPEGMG